MTYKNTRTNNNYNSNANIDNKQILHNNIDSWCQIVLDLLDLTFAELFYGFPHIIAWIVVWILPDKHFETQTPVNFITIAK